MAPRIDDRLSDDGTLLVRVFLVREDGYWTAIARDFTVLGTGASQEEAIRRLGEFLADYLDLCEREGKSIAEATRPLSLRWRMQLQFLRVRSTLAGAMRRVRPVSELEMPLHRPLAC